MAKNIRSATLSTEKGGVMFYYSAFLRSKNLSCAESSIKTYKNSGEKQLIPALTLMVFQRFEDITTDQLRSINEAYERGHNTGDADFIHRHIKTFFRWYWVEYDVMLMAAVQSMQYRTKGIDNQSYLYSLERYQSMMEQTRRTIDKYNRAALGRISGAEADAVKIGNANAKKLINIAAPDDPLWTRINQREGRIISGMLSDTSPLRRLLDKSWGETSRKVFPK